MNPTLSFALSILIVFPLVGHAQVYRCIDPDTGGTIFSQTQCQDGDSERMQVSSAPAPAAGARTSQHEELAHRCAQLGQFKDPESVRIEQIGNLTADVIDYAGTRIVAHILPIWINAHNSYGGYTGSKLYFCYLSQHDRKVLRLEQISDSR